MSTIESTSEKARVIASFAQLGLTRDQLSLAWDARAKLTWGERPADVETTLVASGVDPQTTRLIMEICLRERASSLRRKGARDTTVGGLLIVLAVLGSMGVFWLGDYVAQFVDLSAKIMGLLWAGCVLPGVYGGYLLVRGLDRVVFGARADGADSDIDEWT